MKRRALPPLLAAALGLFAAGSAGAEGAPARLLPDIVSGAMNDYNFNTSADGALAVFARSEAGFANSRIMVMAREGGGWSAPAPIGFSDPRWKDSDPWLLPDGSAILFASNRPTAARPDKTDLDIWMSRRTADGGWSAPEHLGDVVNSKGYELGPELHGDTLYFNSSRPGGPGQLDIFASRRVDGGWQTPEPLPAPMNSPAQEGDFTLTADGTRAFFWSLREGKGLIYTAVRRGDGWSEPVALAAGVNDGPFQFTPQVGADGTTLTYAGTLDRAGQESGLADIYTLPLARILGSNGGR